jgi:hypothetical protein
MKNGILVRKLAEMEETLRWLREHLPTDYEEFSRDWVRRRELASKKAEVEAKA